MAIACFLAAYILPLLVLAGALLGGAYVWAGFLFGVFGHTAIEYAFNRVVGATAPVFRQEPVLGNVILFAYVPVQTAVMFVALSAFGNPAWPWLDQLGLALSVGTMTGAIGITAAHELVHRRTATERDLGLWLLLQVSYLVFEIEHIRGHHRYVATPRDTSTAKKGETIYAFVPRTIRGTYRVSAGLERQAGRTGWRSLVNRYIAIQLATAALVAAAFGWPALLWFWVQGAVAVFYLEAVNYIEHYGLERPLLANGRYADVDETHSWDTYGAVTNAYLFKLGFHSDHHIAAARPYPLLRSHDPADVLPAGYSAMILLSLVPPMWRRVMDWRVDRRMLKVRTA
jgi:alkane 1-monooxygenase